MFRQLEDELEHMKEHFKSTLTEYQEDIDKLRKDNDEQQKLWINNTSDPQTQKEQLIHYEVARIATENVIIQV